MDSSSSSTLGTWRYPVFASFHGPDVRKTFMSHLRKQFNDNAIMMYDDQGIERSQIISPSLMQAIRESRILIVVLSKNYASSRWCLDELVEILKCKEDLGKIVMTIFYDVDPSDVRKQTGEFGSVFRETRACISKEESERWSKALNDVGNIAGEHFLNWNTEANMIEKIARDVLNKLNASPSWDFDGMVGLEAHLREVESLLHLDYVGVKMIGIYGPAGIGKATIARALHSRLSNRFQLTCFVDNLRGSCHHSGLDEYGQKLHLHEQFLLKVLNQNGIKICHLGATKENLSDQKVFIILDDVNNLKQLEALADETTWFGPGSRILITTEDKELLQQHGINNTYHVGFPSNEEALEILCRYSFKKSSPPNGYMELAESVTNLCGYLPLGLRVVGSSLLGKKEDEWIYVMHRLETILGRDIEDILKVGYENLDESDQTLFLHIAVFFNYKDCDLVEAMLIDGNLDVKNWLKILVNRSLIEITNGKIVMHKLLQQVGRQAIHRQEPWKRQILIDSQKICDVFENDTGTSDVSGISSDTTGIIEVCISGRAFKRMRNLRFLRIFKSRVDGNDRVHIPEEMEFPRRLRLLHWEAYPSKSLPPRFHPEYLVELDMKYSKLEKLWDGIEPLTNLKKMDLHGSLDLKELPDLSKATNLETLGLSICKSLVELPSSFSNLHKLKNLGMSYCINLEVIPTKWNLASLESLHMNGCSRLRNFPYISTNIKIFDISETLVKHVPTSVTLWSQLKFFDLHGNGQLKTLPQLPTNITFLGLSNNGFERISCCIKGLQRLTELRLSGCRKLTSLPELPPSLRYLLAQDCESLETIFVPWKTENAHLDFTNCFKLDQQAQRAIIQQQSFGYGSSCLPGSEMPAEFEHRATGNTLTFPLSAFSSFKICLVICLHQQNGEWCDDPRVLCRRIRKGYLYPIEDLACGISRSQTKHLFIFHSDSFDNNIWLEVSKEITFKFSSKYQDFDIFECGVQILTDETFGSNNEGSGDEDGGNDHWDTHESGEASNEEEDDDDNIAEGRSVRQRRWLQI